MAQTLRVFISYDAAPWEETKHPRGAGGRFGHGGGGVHASSTAWTGRPESARPPSPRAAAGAVSKAVKGFSKADYDTFKQQLPAAQQSLGRRLAVVAHSLPTLMKTHLAGEKEKAVHAAGALKAMATGRLPTAEQKRGLLAFGLSVLLSTASLVTHGDPTGAVGHVAMALGQEFVQHAALEHTARVSIGVARYAMGGGDAALGTLGPEDIRLLQHFVATLAHTVATHKIPEDRLRELFEKTSQG